MEDNSLNISLQFKWFDSLEDLTRFINTNKIPKENVQNIVMKNGMSWVLIYWE